MRLAVVLLGDHGGELDRVPFEVKEGQDEIAVIRNVIVRAIQDWAINPGDTIRIENTEG